MKVKLEYSYKQYYTLEEYECAKYVIKQEKEDDETPKGWAEYAVREALKEHNDYLVEVLKAEAATAKNSRVWNAYGNSEFCTQTMDVWVDATAKTIHGFIEVGAYLTDIWKSGAEPYADKMYIKYYGEYNLQEL